MLIQNSFADVVDKFLDSKECLQNFIESLEIPNLKQSEIIRAEFIKDNDFTKSVCDVQYKGENEVIDGFVITCKDYDIIFVSKSDGYIAFWGFRNFFGFKCAQKHYFKNDRKIRYLVNILPKVTQSKLESYNIYKNFYIWNISNPKEELKNWLKTLYK